MEFATILFLFLSLLSIGLINETCAQSSPNCTKYYRTTHRNGLFIFGKLSIPMTKETRLSDGEEGFKLIMKFNRAVRDVSIRQARARDMGSHTEFLFDGRVKDGVMKMDTTVRLRSFVNHHIPTVTRIAFNDKSLCGAPLSQEEMTESVVVTTKPEPVTSSSTSKNAASSWKLTNNWESPDYY